MHFDLTPLHGACLRFLYAHSDHCAQLDHLLQGFGLEVVGHCAGVGLIMQWGPDPHSHAQARCVRLTQAGAREADWFERLDALAVVCMCGCELGEHATAHCTVDPEAGGEALAIALLTGRIGETPGACEACERCGDWCSGFQAKAPELTPSDTRGALRVVQGGKL
jgi:hypothetical protein